MKNIDIVYENEEILVVNKKAGISVQGGEGVSHPLDKELPEILGYPVYLVHRLDKETAGLLIVAKSSFAAAKWTKLIQDKKIRKEYTAICTGKLSSKAGTIKTSVVQHGNEKPAITNYKVIEEKKISLNEFETTLTKVKLILETGRMHQIRIHLSKQNCPIAGDDKHGNFKLNKILKKELKIKNLLLCASKLTIPNECSGTNRSMEIEIPLPDYMNIL